MIRKITSKEDEEKRRKRNSIIVGVILVAIMMFSTIGYSFGTNSNSSDKGVKNIIYNGFEFNYSNGFWIANIGQTAYYFSNSPLKAYNATENVNSLSNYYKKPLYIYSQNSDAESEIYKNLYGIASEITYACLSGGELDNCDKTLPVKTCNDNFIIIKEKNESRISQINNCVYIEGQMENLTRMVDGFLLRAIGIQ